VRLAAESASRSSLPSFTHRGGAAFSGNEFENAVGTIRGPALIMASTEMTSSIGARLLADHQRFDVLFSQLLADMHAGDWRVCQSTWSRFERELLAHMAAEEALVLPSFELVNPAETVRLREEHATVRRRLADLGVGIELHAVKEEHVQRLVESLRSHAAREDALLYRWASQLSPDLQKALFKRLSSHGVAAEGSTQGRMA
jgi:hypothetical protein